jgi:HTH-type transcriptional regulator/antitoxin HipB
MSYVYVITNDWCPGLSKLGATSNVEERFATIRATLPGESILRWFKGVDDCFAVESIARTSLVEFAVPSSRDWFNCPHDVIVRQFEAIIDKQETSLITNRFIGKASQKIDTPSNLGLYCRTIRAKHGLTQAELAEVAGVGVRFVSEFENGKETCEIGLVIRVAKTLGVDVFAVRRTGDSQEI